MKPKKKRGAQPNNKNAFKHGYYSDLFRDEQKKRMDKEEQTELLSEINLCRAFIENLAKEISFDEKLRIDNNGDTFRDNHYLQQLNSLSNILNDLNGFVRTHYLTHKATDDETKSILEALELIRLDMGVL